MMRLRMLLIAGAASSLVAVGCKGDAEEPGNDESVGDELEEAAEETGDDIEDATEEAGDDIEDATD